MSTQIARIGELICGKPPDILQANALGSCIALVIFDPISKVSAMSHILLPERPKNVKNELVGKYANEAPIESVRIILKNGGRRSNLVAKLAGGAKMFEELLADGYLDIGRRNIKAVTEILKKIGIPIAGQDIGGKSSRTISFDTSTGMLRVKNVEKSKTTTI